MLGRIAVVLIGLLLTSTYGQHHGHEHGSSKTPQKSFELDFSIADTNATLYWKVDWKYQVLNFTLLVAGNIPNFVVLGFSDHGILVEDGMDFCAYNFGNEGLVDGYVEKIDGQLSVGFDMHQDCILQKTTKNGSTVAIEFSRKFMTCDPRDYAFEPGTVNVHFFVNNGSDVRSFSLDEGTALMELRSAVMIRHQKMGEPPLVVDENAKPENGNTEWYLDLKVKDAKIPAQVTTYWCTVHKLDPYYQNNINYVLQSDLVLTEGTEHLVHHALMYHCTEPVVFNDNCFTNGPDPEILRTCSKVLAGWAMGMGPITLPPETGLPIGGSEFSPFILIEIHYNNLDLKEGLVDNSGFRLLFSSNPRKYNVGIMELGLIYGDANSIPPRQKSWAMTGFCMPECTKNFPEEGITIFGTHLHSHNTGRRIFTSHFRDGVKIGEINRDNHFYTHWQHFQPLTNYIKVLPGDMLMTTCVYDTSWKMNWTLGGYGTDDEMCLNSILYYPASDLSQCQSAIDNATLHQFFEERGVADKSLSISEKYAKVDWTKKNLNALKELYHVGKLNVNCVDRTGERVKDTGTKWEGVDRPQPYGGIYERVRSSDECFAMNDY